MTVLSIARQALASGPVCNNCLGRLVADRSFGLGNDERGRGLRVALALEDDADFEAYDGGCWVCEQECERFDWWAEQAATATRGYEFDTYQVGTKVPPLLEENDRLLREDAGLDPEAGEPMKKEFNREVGKRVGDMTGTEVDLGRPDVQILCDLATDEVEVTVHSAFVYGRYRKLERDIPQTRWPCTDCNGTGRVQGKPCDGCDGTGYRYDESVEQLTAPVVREAMDGESATFHGAGREDVDALMLDSGRPFVIEVDTPRIRRVDTDALEAEINEFADGKAEVEGVRLATYDMVERVKELDASKTYRMTVEFAETVTEGDFQTALDALDGATIAQETPQRVSHRRAAKTRTREVYGISGTLDDECHATVEIDGEGGLYVKELISSDGGRTEPSLAGELGVEATVTALDVLDVTGEDEPFEDPEFFLE
ncbi:tRNA pseudouridine synthase 10 [Halovenus aranensis]|uniref:tRNA pseudouridine synthase Pus10 n=1 Tax=Halovenus aranensis TaxID=890420 RepID=A0A1G8XF84_9EURY|nr:tRNA pseudouridine(54/55) synthase Pus10 [Halovenus aranensis]SDJ89163.1 tRNA pseudouridine synthase 10 [Halovenus aranensis]